MSVIRVLHLVGSPTSQASCELSELYAGDCIAALRGSDKYEFIIALVTPDGQWRFPVSLERSAIQAAQPMALHAAIEVLAQMRIDIALPQMFCLAGMTHYRALLELLRIPYLGNRPLQMALTADKAKAKAVVSAAGVQVPDAELLGRGEQPGMLLPAVVKPNAADNSDGISLVTQASGYQAALDLAFAHSDSVLVERYIPLGREVRCAVVEEGGRLRHLPLEEYFVDTVTRPVRTRADKLKRDSNNKLVLAAKQASQAWTVDEGDPIVKAVWEAASLCHVALGCEQYSLFDFRIDPEGRPWFLEAGLYCSFSPKSVIVTMMAAAGTPLAEFFDAAVAQVLSASSSAMSPSPSPSPSHATGSIPPVSAALKPTVLKPNLPKPMASIISHI